MTGMVEKHKVTRAAGVVGAATLASRVGGFVRDVVIAYFFGAGPAADAFFVAFRIPNLLRRLFAEGTLTISFIPIFTEVLRKKGKEEAVLLARSTYTLLALTLLLVCVLGAVFAQEVVRVMAPGFSPDGETFKLAVTLTRWCLPYIFFVSLVALAGGVLNSMEHFFAPAASPVLLNLSLIACAVALAPRVEPPVFSLAVGVILGGVAQLLMQLPYLRERKVGLKPFWDLKNPHLRRILRLMVPAAFGAAIYQLTVLLNTILASFLPTGSISFLYYADRLIEFPLGIFAIAVSTAVLPSLSRQAADGDRQALVDTMGFALRLTLFVNVPAMVGLIILAEPLVVLLFTRGQFGPDSAAATSAALVGYGVGLWAYAGVRSVVPAFYALKDTKTPVKVGAVCLLINLGFSLVLMGPLLHVGLAVATSAAGVVNFMGLLWLLRRRLGGLGGRRILRSLWRVAVASLIMGVVVWLTAHGLNWGPKDGLYYRLARPLLGVMAGTGAYLAAAWLMRLPELGELALMLRRRAN